MVLFIIIGVVTIFILFRLRSLYLLASVFLHQVSLLLNDLRLGKRFVLLYFLIVYYQRLVLRSRWFGRFL